mgnify:CR=1 FL=1
MPHYNSYDSFKTKKSLEKKRRAKEKAFGKKMKQWIILLLILAMNMELL